METNERTAVEAKGSAPRASDFIRADLDWRLALAIADVRAALLARSDVSDAIKSAVLQPNP